MKKASNIIYVIIFFSILIIPSSLTNIKPNVQSDLDNRVLQELPMIGNVDFENRIEAYIQDRIGLRDQMVTGYQLVNSLVAGELVHPLYMYGQEGYVFFKMHNNVEYGSFHQTFAEAVVKMKDYCNDRSVPFYFEFDPEKISVYRRYLPKGVNYNDDWVDTFLGYLKEHDVKVVNNRDLLIEKSYKEQVFNRQYDAGHWNDLGCYYGTNNLWRTVQEDFSAVTEYSFDDFEIKKDVGKYLAMSNYPVYEEIPLFMLNKQWEDKSNEYSGLKKDVRYPFFQYSINISEDSSKYPKMLVFHGSYYNRAPYFYIGRTKEYIGIHDYQNVLRLDYYFNVFQPEMVVFEVAEYTFDDSYFDENEMGNLDYNPALSIADLSRIQNTQIDEETNLFIHPVNGVDEITIEKDLGAFQYVYIIDDGKAYDLQKEDGIYHTDVSKNAIDANRTLLYCKRKDGSEYISQCTIKLKLDYMGGAILDSYSGSNNMSLDNNTCIFTTDILENGFTGVDIQLWNKDRDQYIETIESTGSIGTLEKSFRFEHESGWYNIRTKANSNKEDEWIDILVYLIYGEEYYYHSEIEEIQEKRITISGLNFTGVYPYDYRSRLFSESIHIE